MIIFQDWCNQNETRNYPLEDLAPKLDAQGRRLPDNLLVDVNLWLPASAGTRVSISSAAVTAGLVTITFVADGGGTPIPVAAVSVARPVTRYRKYSVQAYYPGVGGWIALGQAAESATPLVFTFTDFTACPLVPKVVHGYDDLPLLSLGKKDRAAALTGLVELRGGDNIQVLACTDDWPTGSDPDYLENPRYKREIDGVPRRCVAIRMTGEPQDYENLYTYAGPCEKAPDSLQCGRRLIQRINGVSPDCEGNLQIEFRNIPTGRVVDSHGQTVGLSLDYPLGLTDVCDPNKGLILPEPADLCESSSSISSLSFSSLSSVSFSSVSQSSSSGACPIISGAWIETFDGDLHCWDAPSGTWSLSNCELFGQSTSGWGVTVLRNTSTLGRDIQAFINIQPTGIERRAYLVFGYESSTRFWFLEIDSSLGRVLVGRRNGPQVIAESLPLWTTISILSWVHLRVTISIAGAITTWINGVAGPTVTAVSGTLSDGLVGFATRLSVAKFDNLAFDWWTTDPANFPPFGCQVPGSSLSSLSSLSGVSQSQQAYGLFFEDRYLDKLHSCQRAAWKMEESAGTRYDELSYQNFEPVNGVVRATGIENYGTEYEGYGYYDYMRTASPVFYGLAQTSLSLWVYLDTVGVPTGVSSIRPDILSEDFLLEYLGSYMWVSRMNLFYHSYDTGGHSASGALHCRFGTTAGALEITTAYGVMTTGWSHIFVSYDSVGQSAHLFVNGVEQASVTGASVLQLFSEWSAAPWTKVGDRLYVGGQGVAYETGNVPHSYEDFINGKLDEIYVWDCVFDDPAEAASRLYRSGSGKFLHWVSPPSSSSMISSMSSSWSSSSIISSSSRISSSGQLLSSSSAAPSSSLTSGSSLLPPASSSSLFSYGSSVSSVMSSSSSMYVFNFSGYFDGSTLITYPDSDEWDFGTGDFTIDAWLDLTAVGPNYSNVIGYVSGTGNGWTDIGWSINILNTGYVAFQASDNGGTGITLANSDSILGGWHHVAVVRDAGTTKLFVDGLMEDSTATAWTCKDGGWTLKLGSGYRTGEYITGDVDEGHVYKGIALWSGNFTPPDSESH